MNVMKLILVCVAFTGLTATSLLADFSYQETTKITGGAMVHMAGASAMKPQTSATYVKGNRLARLGPEHGQITDLDKETITNVNFTQKTYSVMTFAEMKAMMAQMAQGASKDGPGADVSFHETGKTRIIGGVTTREMVLTAKVAGSQINSDVWLAPMVSGYDEVRQFQQRMALKMGAAGAPGMQRIMAEAAKALTKANGVPVLQISSIRGGMEAGAPGGDGPMMETSSELSGFSSASVDASKFEIPAGFQKTETPGRRPPAKPQGQGAH
jgi:hypothetical protein